MTKKLKIFFVILILLFSGYHAAKYYSVSVLENQTGGMSVFIAQLVFPPEDLFLPVYKMKFNNIDLAELESIRFNFTPKYIGPYMVGISGRNNNIFFIPKTIHARLECNYSENIYTNSVDTVVMFSGTPHSDKGAVLGILNLEDQSQVLCSTNIDQIIFDDINISNYQLVVSRMYIK